jgi:hypothetical protein
VVFLGGCCFKKRRCFDEVADMIVAMPADAKALSTNPNNASPL